MSTPLQKFLIVSAAMISVTAIPAVLTADNAFSSAAYARGGSDGSGGDDHGGGSGSGNSGGDDQGGRSGGDKSGNGDHGHRGGQDDSADDRGGQSGGDDDHGRKHGRDHAEDGKNGNQPRENRLRPGVVLSVSRESLAGLLNGSLVAVDQLGRRLEIELENEHGTNVVKAEVHRSDAVRKPGPITNVKVVAP
ncbi:hypothetical protein EHI43_13780 [Rhizobium leguminosarum]|nr:hypothetical protein EHI43_13780 [Rhizobium leguminosarum]